MTKYDDFKKEISDKFSEMEEIDGVYRPVEFNAVFSHDQVIKKQVKDCVLASELHNKPKKKIIFDNRFLSKRMREIMFLPVKQ